MKRTPLSSAALLLIASLLIALGLDHPVLVAGQTSLTLSPNSIATSIIASKVPTTMATTDDTRAVMSSPYDDEFDSSVLDPQWSWIREDPSHWSLTERPGFLRIVSQWGSYATGTVKNTAVQVAPPGDFMAATKVDFLPTQDWQQASIMIYENDQNLFAMARRYHSSFVGCSVHCGSYDNGALHGIDVPVSCDLSPTELLVSKTGNVYRGAYRNDIGTWIQVCEWELGISPDYLALEAHNGTSGAGEIPADFDFIHVTSEEADLDFTPNPDGYSFDNWEDTPEATWEDFRAVYGSENIELCNAAGTCWPNFTANAYFMQHFRPASWHCYGMSVTSLRFFAGLASPSDLDPSAGATYDLSRSDDVEHHIGQYQRYQSALNISNRIEYKRTHSTPNTVLLELSAALRLGSLDPLVLGLISNDGTTKHAVVPYRAIDRGSGIWWVYVYDNEDHGATDRYVEFDTNDNSWNYVIEKFLWFQYRTWSGDADDFHIVAIELQQHEEARVPPWNSEVLPVLPFAGALTLLGSGDLLIQDQYGNLLGFVDEQLISEIPGAFPIVPMVGAFNEGQSPDSYSIPVSTTYSISLTGESTAESGIGTLTLFAPDRSLTLDSLTTSATSNDSIVFNEQLSGFTYETMDSTKPFSFTMTYEHPSGYSERFGVTDSAVDTSGIIAIEVITATESIMYLNSSATAKPYDLEIDLVSVEGVDSFRHQGLEVLGADTHVIGYANWPTNDYVTLYIDHQSNGTVDETIVLKNEINRVYLPLVLRGLP